MLKDGLLELQKKDTIFAEIVGGRLSQIEAALEQYISEIELFNPIYGLVSVGDRTELVVKHILDSLAPAGIIQKILREARREKPCIADAGSGAGLPGIPLAIVFSHIPVTLIERMGRRANFLRNTAAVLRLSNVEIIEKPMEEAPPKRFDAVCFRAFRPLDAAILQNLRRLLKPGGFLAAYKGRLDRVQAEMAGVKTICPSWEAIHCPVPFLNDERRLLIIG